MKTIRATQLNRWSDGGHVHIVYEGSVRAMTRVIDKWCADNATGLFETTFSWIEFERFEDAALFFLSFKRRVSPDK